MTEALSEVAKVEAEIAIKPNEYLPSIGDNLYISRDSFTYGKEVATVIAKSTLIPESYQNNPANCLMAFDMALRWNVSPFVVMQKVSPVKGKPTVEAQLLIAIVNRNGIYTTGIQWEMSGEGDTRTAVAWGKRSDGRIEKSTPVTISMAKGYGWYANSAHWKNNPDQMLKYRSATYLIRVYCPELSLGLHTTDEILDVEPNANRQVKKLSTLNDK